MKKFLFLVALIIATSMGLNAQECNVKGVVKYEYNDYVGYKIDEGAEIYVLSKQKADSIDIQIWQEYEKLAKNYMRYLKYKNDDDFSSLDEATICRFAGFSTSSKSVLDKYDKKCFHQYCYFVENAEYIEVVDGSGKYSLKLPYGEYFILAKSKNRERPLVSELTGRILIEKITVNKPTKIVSFDFCY